MLRGNTFLCVLFSGSMPLAIRRVKVCFPCEKLGVQPGCSFCLLSSHLHLGSSVMPQSQAGSLVEVGRPGGEWPFFSLLWQCPNFGFVRKGRIKQQRRQWDREEERGLTEAPLQSHIPRFSYQNDLLRGAYPAIKYLKNAFVITFFCTWLFILQGLSLSENTDGIFWTPNNIEKVTLSVI